MKLRESFRFPYPVLNETSSDYLADTIDLDLLVQEHPSSGEMKISYKLRIDSETIKRELSSENSRAYLSVVCRDAYYNEFFELPSNEGSIEITGGNLYGRVDVRAVVVRTIAGCFEASGLPEEYTSSKFLVDAGAVIAWTQPQAFNVGLEKLAPMESIFKLSLDNDLAPGTYDISYDDEYVTIRAPQDLLTTISAMRTSSYAKPVVLNSVYFPAVMAVLEAFKNEGEFAERRWYRVIEAKADLIGVDPTATPLAAAQGLLKAPAARLTAFMEKAEK